MNGLGRRVLFFSIGLLLTALQAHAGGLWLTLQPTPDMGVGGAGSQAAGFDASTATANPAAMTRLDRSQVETGIMGIYVDSQFNVKTPAGGNDGGNAGYFSPVPMLNFVHSVSPDLKLGLGVGSYFGLGFNYSNEWAGKYYSQSVSYTTMAINPTIGYRIALWLSVGGGASLVQGNLIPICNQIDTMLYSRHGGDPWRERLKSVKKNFYKPSKCATQPRALLNTAKRCRSSWPLNWVWRQIERLISWEPAVVPSFGTETVFAIKIASLADPGVVVAAAA